MPPVPPDRATLDGITLPLTDSVDAAHPTAPPDRPRHKDPEQIGQYRILERIGEGGMGVVYRAEQREPVRRVVALKIIKLGMDSKEVVARFEAERQALALMSHPNVAKVFEAGMTEADRPYFAMELVPGIPVTRFCDDERLTIRQRLEVFVPICQAVQHAHQKGIIHRDLKPSNILVQLIDGKSVPKVIDFGVAKATNQALTQHTLYTQTGTLVGTPEYMSPEQAMTGGLDVDTRTDIYSLGVILYELLTGTLPVDPKSLRSAGFEGMARMLKETEPPKPSTKISTVGTQDGNSGELWQRIAKSRHSDISALRRELRGDLDWIVLKAMEKERSRRYETANGLAMDIQRHLDDEPVAARPPSTVYRFQKLVRRNKLAFVGAAGFVLALLLGLATSTFLFMRESAARHRAVAAELEQTRLRKNETELRRRAQAQELAARQQELAARQRSYASDMNLVQQALAVNNLGRAQNLLDRQRPRPGEQDLRGWEWRYLWQFCRSDATFVLCQQPHEIWSLAVSQDGALAGVGEFHGGGLSIWDLRTRQRIATPAAGGGLVPVAFSPTRPLLAYSAKTDAESPAAHSDLILWDTAKRQTVAQLPLGGACDALTFSADGRRLIVLTPAQIILFEVPSEKKLRAFDANGAEGDARAPFVVAHDTSVAAYVAPGGVIHVIDLGSGKERWQAKTDDFWVTALAFSPDEKILASGAGFAGSSIQLRNAATGKLIGQLEGHRAWISSLVFWPDGKTLASSSADQTIRLWDISKGFELPPSRVLRGHRLEVWRLALLPDNRTLISGGKDGSVYLWDTATTAHDRGHFTVPARILDCHFAPDSQSIVAIEQSGRVARWYGPDFAESQPLLEIGSTPAASSISPDCRLITAALPNDGVKVWDLGTGALLHEVASPNEQFHVALQGHTLLLYRSSDNTVHKWDLVTWKEILSSPCAAGTAHAALSPNSRWVLTLG